MQAAARNAMAAAACEESQCYSGCPGHFGGCSAPRSIPEAEAEAAGHSGPGVSHGGAMLLPTACTDSGPGGHSAEELNGHSGEYSAAQSDGCSVLTGTSAESQLLHFFLQVAFRSDVDAEMALQYLSQHIQSPHGIIHKELTICDNVVAIQLTGGDPDQLQNSITSCLEHLSFLIEGI